MKPLSRHEAEIFRLATLRGSCSISELAERLGVSDETVRRHIRPLVERGQLEKVHGGIVLPDRLREAPMERRMGENRAAKQAIAKTVSAMIDDGDTLMLDTGSTTAYVAVALSGKQGLHVVTNSTEIGRILARQSTNKVYLVGGEVSSDQFATFGPQAIEFLHRFNVRHGILSIGGINSKNELFNYSLDEAEFSRAVIRQAASVTIVADYTKFSRHALVKVCNATDIDTFITDREPPQAFRELLSENDTHLVIADSQ